MTIDTPLPTYLPYPLFLLTTNLAQTAQLLFALLLGRTTLSQKNGWVDEQEHIYVLFTLQGLAKAANRGITAVKGALNELEAAGLIERRRKGFSMPSRIFVKLPSFGQDADLMPDGKEAIIEPEKRPSHGQKSDLVGEQPITQPEKRLFDGQKTDLVEEQTVIEPENQPSCGRKSDHDTAGKTAIIEPENRPSQSRKSGSTMVGNPSPNYVSINYLNNNYLRGAGEKHESLGRYKNVFLTKTELSALQTEFPDQWQRYIERLSEYMASTGKAYKNHIATIRRWASTDEKKSDFPDYRFQEGESL